MFLLTYDFQNSFQARKRTSYLASLSFTLCEKMKRNRGIKFAILLGLTFGGFLVLLELIFYGFDLRDIITEGLIGVFIGAVAAPEFEPKYFKRPILWQMTCSAIACSLIAFAFESPPEGYLAAVLAGAAIGYFAPAWLDHV